MEEKLLRTIHLSNGLTLHLYDRSQKIAGDRWQVSVIARINIPVDDKSVDEKHLHASLVEVKNLLGDAQAFEQKLQRNFIDAHEKEKIVDGLTESLLTGVAPYFSNENFAVKYVSKLYREAAKRQKWVFAD
jgi:hypothetical protein